MQMKLKILLLSVVCTLMAVCTLYFTSTSVPRSPASVRENSIAKENTSYYQTHVKPIFDNRCVACHACEAAPCQLKLDSYEGVDRGATAAYPKAVKVHEQQQTRIFKDAKTTSGWRKIGFWPVLNRDKNLTAEERLQQSLLYQYVVQGKKQYTSGALEEKAPRAFKECVQDINQFHKDLENPENQNRGMPFGAPALSAAEIKIIENWVAMGSPGPTQEEQHALKTASNRNSIDQWETFLNGTDNRSAWTAKYLYEHLFLAHFHFDDNPGEFFELQRSYPGAPYGSSDEIVTKFPFNDPKQPFVYRFNKVHSTIAHKVHIVYKVNKATLDRLKELFLGTSWGKKEISPISFSEINPFYNFAQIPAKIRYLFMIENSRLIMDFFTRGPVCSGGSRATWVIQDHSWAFFEHPEFDISVTDPQYYDLVKDKLVIPTMDYKDYLWSHYMSRTEQYEKIHAELVAKHFPEGRSLKHIWDGEGTNPNAMLTLYRHAGYSVSVHHGQIGQVPKTFGLMNYATFERIYYDLVAGFNIYGSLKHKINSRLMITQLRRELEDNYLSFLPEKLRRTERKKWYTDKKEERKTYHFVNNKTNIQIKNTDDAAGELATQIISERLNEKTSGPIDVINGHARLGTSATTTSSISDAKSLSANLTLISGVKGGFPQHFPETSYFAFKQADGTTLYYTVIRNRAHFSVHYLFGEEKLIDEEGTTLNILKDFPLSFPVQFFSIDMADAQSFIEQIHNISSLEDYQQLEKKYGIAKGDARFWPYYDHLNQHIMKLDPVNGGVLDINRYGLHHFPEYKF